MTEGSIPSITRAWINMNKELSTALSQMGFKKRIKTLTPKMVSLIVEHLGPP